MVKSIKEIIDETLIEFQELQKLGDAIPMLIPQEMKVYLEGILSAKNMSEDQAILIISVVYHKVISNKT